jgi:hypothetical protein
VTPREQAEIELIGEALAKTGEVTLIAHGMSMWPSVLPGTPLRLRPPRRLRLGQVIVVWDGADVFLAHRLVGLRADGSVLLKGDNCPAPDGWMPRRWVLAVVDAQDRGCGWEHDLALRAPAPRWRRGWGRLRRTLRSML